MPSKLAPVLVIALLFLLCGAEPAFAQQCPHDGPEGPQAPSRVQSLEGRLVYHDGIRQWFELEMAKPKCGQTSLQLTADDRVRRELEALRGCRIRSSGLLDHAPTGYYSLDLYQQVRKAQPVGACTRKPPFPGYSHAAPDPHVRSYTVAMEVDYGAGDRPIVFHARSGGKELRPWQAYAGYMLTGSFILYGSCGTGFVVDRVYGTPEANPSHFDEPRTPLDRAAFDPEGAAQAGKPRLHLGYSCIRAPAAE
ncbi:MAG: hypothetical protein E6G94_11065 [Alphaproteobacteria bacterium]|nr:MAG: hypothetical protein E6G94_11065 [Alphaproteobacteria bacterium]